jgi:Tfp pilus assembly protein FimT
MRVLYPTLVSLLSIRSSAFAQTPDFRGTVNEVAPAQEERARAAVTHAGYQPTVLQAGQDGNLFFTAMREGNIYTVTVTRSGQVFVSTPLPEARAG